MRNAFVAFVSFLRFALLQHLALDFFDEKRQVGTSKAQVGGWDAMMLDVRRHMLVVGKVAWLYDLIEESTDHAPTGVAFGFRVSFRSANETACCDFTFCNGSRTRAS